MREDGQQPSGEVARLFAEFLREGDLEDERAFASLCEAHPEERSALLSLWENWHLAEALLKSPAGNLGAAGGSLAQRLAKQVGREVDPGVTLDDESAHRVEERVIEEFGKAGSSERYEPRGEVARGAMGVVELVWDRELRRPLAKKSMLEHSNEKGSSARVRRMTRFLEEAQITGQLDHPGIVPVHEIGLDSNGKLFFTMKLVKGETLDAIFARYNAGDIEWPLARIVALFLRICEAMSYATAKGVLHRDLKPSNVMVGRFGEVYVMDWGLAHVLDREDSKDIRLDTASGGSTELYSSRRRELTESGSPLLTKDGDVVGTINYMAPEQAAGRLNELGPHSDLYSVGAMLYHLLSRRAPYLDETGSGPLETLDRLLEGPPEPLQRLAPQAPAELVAIVEKAMARDWRDRYTSFEALVSDLRAFLHGRVVGAYESGPVAELKKWVARNPLVAGAIAAVILVLAGSGFAVAFQERQKAEARRGRVIAALVERAERSWPARPESLARMEQFLEEVEELRPEVVRASEPANVESSAEDDYGTREFHLRYARTKLEEELEMGREALLAGAVTAEEAELQGWSLDVIEHELALLDEPFMLARMDLGGPPLDEGDAQLRNERALFDAKSGWVTWVRRLLDDYRRVEEESMVENTEAWVVCSRGISESELYGGLELGRQFGLVPLGVNAAGLWEFWHVPSGERPVANSAGGYEIDADAGIVLVLIPGGSFRMGREAEAAEPPLSYEPEHAIDGVTLEPFFLSKYELTQGQWWCVTRDTPSEHFAGFHAVGTKRITRAHPVERVSYDESARVLALLGLGHPTEAQWEYAARGGKTARYVFGSSPTVLRGHANYFDDTLHAAMSSSTRVGHSDGYSPHAPVDSFQPNPFGLHSMFGNVWEWCRDWWCDDYDLVDELMGSDREIKAPHHYWRVVRGGSYRTGLPALAPAVRMRHRPQMRREDVGVRPSRSIDSRSEDQ